MLLQSLENTTDTGHLSHFKIQWTPVLIDFDIIYTSLGLLEVDKSTAVNQ